MAQQLLYATTTFSKTKSQTPTIIILWLYCIGWCYLSTHQKQLVMTSILIITTTIFFFIFYKAIHYFENI
ncbi:hypothetical protein ACFOWM_05515 [Ferruginibacter yonginensis]|uniref:Uncharacterized protein n=1 Tax=Ferruginibacter yonginensis TaxID=1310416 RepID=A0ABV8QR55_9BACT